MIITLCACLWLLVSFFNFGAINAHVRAEFGHDRHMISISAFFALLPIAGTAVAIFGTGFIEHGFDWHIH